MSEFNSWRGFDLSKRVKKIQRAFERAPVSSADDIPILINTPCYFSFGTTDKPVDYYTNPASMLDYQTRGYAQHLKLVEDDYVPYFMPWFGTGVLASGFGAQIRLPEDPADDPAVAAPMLTSPAEVARLRLPEPYKDGWMPRVLQAIDYATERGDLLVGLTDMQGPLDTIGQLCGQAQLYQWMFREPQMMHDLFDIVTEAFIEWVKIQKLHIGEPLESSNGLQGAFSPGCGVWESDDDLVLINADLYEEFVVPRVTRIFEAFGGGSVHFCGNGNQHLENLHQIRQLKVVNNSPMGHYAAFHRLVQSFSGEVTIQIQDASPVNVEEYYANLFADVHDFRGIMLATFILDNTGMDGKGGYLPVQWDALETAQKVVQIVRRNIAKRLAGEPTLNGSSISKTVQVRKKEPEKAVQKPALTDVQGQAVTAVQQAMLDFDQKAVQTAVQAAIDAGVQPFDIIIRGMAEAMEEVGRRYEAGDYFLPELVMAGATMQSGMEVLQPHISGSDKNSYKGTVILGTVKGDMHDIGKNLVKTMLEGAGFNVIDLGVDVPPETFVQSVISHQGSILAMSALLTTTMVNMRGVMEALKAAGLRQSIKVMIGGAPISREFADQIEAEGYASTAVGAVHEAERLQGLIKPAAV